MRKLIILVSCVVFSLPTIAQLDQSECKRQAIPAVDTVKFVSNLEMGVTDVQKQAAEDRLKKLERLLSEGRYCEALQLATTK